MGQSNTTPQSDRDTHSVSNDHASDTTYVSPPTRRYYSKCGCTECYSYCTSSDGGYVLVPIGNRSKYNCDTCRSD